MRVLRLRSRHGRNTSSLWDRIGLTGASARRRRRVLFLCKNVDKHGAVVVEARRSLALFQRDMPLCLAEHACVVVCPGPVWCAGCLAHLMRMARRGAARCPEKTAFSSARSHREEGACTLTPTRHESDPWPPLRPPPGSRSHSRPLQSLPGHARHGPHLRSGSYDLRNDPRRGHGAAIIAAAPYGTGRGGALSAVAARAPLLDELARTRTDRAHRPKPLSVYEGAAWCVLCCYYSMLEPSRPRLRPVPVPVPRAKLCLV